MLSLVFTIAVAAVIAIGFVDVVKNFLPDTVSTKVKTIIGIVFEAAVGAGVGVIDAMIRGSSALPGALYTIVVAAGTVAAAQFGYTYFAKPIKTFFEAVVAKFKGTK